MGEGASCRGGRLTLLERQIKTYRGVGIVVLVSIVGALAPVAHAAAGTAPETTITGGPPEGSELNSTSATFTFSSSAKGQTKFYCSLDGAPATTCSSGVTYSNLTTSPHSFSVYSVDRSGTADPTPATRSWTVTTSGEVYPVPASVPSGCSTDATSKILSWIASVPNNSTLRFGASACYRIEGTLELKKRNLTLDGNGSTFKSLNAPSSQRAMWRVWDSTVAFRNMTISGSYANGGVIDRDLQWAHGIDLRGTDAVVENVSMSDLAGDCVYFGLGADRSSGAVRDSSCRRIGRNGVSVTAGDDILVERTTTNKIGHIVFDVEPNTGSGNWGSCRVTFDSNTIRTYWLYAWTLIGSHAPICEQAFTNNRLIGEGLRIAALRPTFRPQHLTVTGNTSDTPQGPPAMEFYGVDGLTVSGNTVPLTSGTMVQVEGSCNVSVSGNSYPGGSQEASITNPSC
jgi:hypothetical protein